MECFKLFQVDTGLVLGGRRHQVTSTMPRDENLDHIYIPKIEIMNSSNDENITTNMKNKGLEMKNKYIWIKVLLQIKVQSGGQGARKPALRNSFPMEL